MRRARAMMFGAGIALCLACATRRDGPAASDTDPRPPAASGPESAPAAAPAAAGPEVALARELALLRAQDQTKYNATPEVMEAARRVFAEVRFVGESAAEARRLLGPPVSDKGGRWLYTFHDGEQGVFRALIIDAGRVAGVEEILTQ
jgi:hypothetical protein